MTIDNPPVSTGNAALRHALHEAFLVIEGRADVDAVVVNSAQSHFYSGSDIREFDGQISSPSLPELIEVIDRLDKPVIAALNGLTLGGGLELALACDARIAASDAKLGLPEVTLGMLPGAGGTVRLPRLIGVARAIDVIAGGRPVRATEALKWGLVDAVVERDDLDAVAVDFARTAKKRRALMLDAPEAGEALVQEAVERGRRGGKARPNVLQAIDLVGDSVATEPAEALRNERAAFEALRTGDEARNLRYLFFAKRAAAKDLSTMGRSAPVSRVGIAGAGTMGSRIAAALLGAGVDVALYEVSSQVIERAAATLRDAGAAAKRWGNLTIVTDVAALRGTQLVIDAVFEDADVKRELLTQLDAVLAADAVIASNTSYLDLNELGTALTDPKRFVGLHFFNPADRNRLLEVVRTAATADAVLATASGLARTLGKTPILAEVGDGFVANRVYADYRRQAEFLVEEGATPREVDSAMQSLGLPIGPFAVADMSGLDIAWARRKRLADSRDPSERYVTIADILCEAGRLGKKSGAGWYRYGADAPRGADDPEVGEIIRQARNSKGITPQTFSQEQIQQRIIGAIILASAALMADGIAQRASDIDVALTEGFGFPTWLGGPIRYAAMQPRAWIIEGLRAVHESDAVAYMLGAEAVDGKLPSAVTALLDDVTP